MNATLRITSIVAVGITLAACSIPVQPMDEGIAFYREGRYLAARDAFDEAVRNSPSSASAHNNRAMARVRLGDLPGAVEDYNRAVALTPLDAEIYFNRGNALVAAGQYEAAVADYTRAMDLNPAYARAAFNRGTAFVYLGRRDAAVADWRRAVELEPDPWTRGAMVRAAGLEPPAVAAAGPVVAPPLGQPTTVTTVAPPPAPGTATGGVPVPQSPVAAGGPQPAAAVSAQGIEARALATRAISRELDGDHAGALTDMRAAIALETDPVRRDSMANLLRLLETPR